MVETRTATVTEQLLQDIVEALGSIGDELATANDHAARLNELLDTLVTGPATKYMNE